MKHWGWDEKAKLLTVYDRESEAAAWVLEFPDFATAKACADSFDRLYNQGVRHGKQKALEEMQRTIDNIDRTL